LQGDFNTIRNNSEKRGGSYARDPSHEKMEGIILDWDLIDVAPSKGKFTWSNKRIGTGHIIVARLDRFFIHSILLSSSSSIKSYILPSLTYDHNPISLISLFTLLWTPPFSLPSLWLSHPKVKDIVSSA
jgi:hypothetical protein